MRCSLVHRNLDNSILFYLCVRHPLEIKKAFVQTPLYSGRVLCHTQHTLGVWYATRNTLQLTAIHCNTLQHTATHCNTLQHTATHCNTPHSGRVVRHRQFFSSFFFFHLKTPFIKNPELSPTITPMTRCNTRQHTATLQHVTTHSRHVVHQVASATHYNILQRTTTHGSTL